MKEEITQNPEGWTITSTTKKQQRISVFDREAKLIFTHKMPTGEFTLKFETFKVFDSALTRKEVDKFMREHTPRTFADQQKAQEGLN